MAIGGQNLTKYLTVVLLAPQRNTANTNPAAIAPLFAFVCTTGNSTIKSASTQWSLVLEAEFTRVLPRRSLRAEKMG
jgi:hypothetical protein